MKYGYARVSTDGQKADLQTAALKKAGCVSRSLRARNPLIQVVEAKPVCAVLNRMAQLACRFP